MALIFSKTASRAMGFVHLDPHPPPLPPPPPQDPVYYFCLSYLSRVIFYFIKVTKTVDGGAAGCKKCPIGMEDEG